METLLRAALWPVLVFAFASCGGGGDTTCRIVGLRVTPATATANHLAAPPGNQVQFGADGIYQGSCAVAACVSCLPGVTWSVSDPVHVSLTSTQPGLSTVVATCMAATNGAVTLTASKDDTTSGQTVTGTATLTCQ